LDLIYIGRIYVNSGKVYASGYGRDGRLGDGRLNDGWTVLHEEQIPIHIDTTNIGDKRVIEVSASNYSLFVCEDGTVYASGDNTDYRLGLGDIDDETVGTPIQIDTSNIGDKRVIHASAGLGISLFVCEDGTVYASGNNRFGQLGIGATVGVMNPIPIKIDTANIGDKRVIQVSAGYMHSLFVCEDGTVYASGDNYYKKLGIGHNNYPLVSTPKQIKTTNIGDKRVINASAGNEHSLFLT